MRGGTLPHGLTPLFSGENLGASLQRTYRRSCSAAGRFGDGRAPGLAVTLLQGIQPEK